MLDESIKNMNGDLMYDKYMGELIRQDLIEVGTNMTFDEFFQMNRFNNYKGVVQIELGTLP